LGDWFDVSRYALKTLTLPNERVKERIFLVIVWPEEFAGTGQFSGMESRTSWSDAVTTSKKMLWVGSTVVPKYSDIVGFHCVNRGDIYIPEWIKLLLSGGSQARVGCTLEPTECRDPCLSQPQAGPGIITVRSRLQGFNTILGFALDGTPQAANLIMWVRICKIR